MQRKGLAFVGMGGSGMAGDLLRVLLEEAHVAAVPGVAFGDDACFRLSYATSTERINEGLDRIEKLLGRFT